MNKLPPPDVPGKLTPSALANAVKMVLAVPPEAVTKKEADETRERDEERDNARRHAKCELEAGG
jgi:hypothetical protein